MVSLKRLGAYLNLAKPASVKQSGRPEVVYSKWEWGRFDILHYERKILFLVHLQNFNKCSKGHIYTV